MIRGYTRPQLLIRQVLEILPDVQTRTLNAFVMGPQFDLFRYTNATERAAMKGVLFAENTDSSPDARQLVPYEGLLADRHVIDADFVKLFGEKLEGQAWQADSSAEDADTNPYDFRLASLADPNKIQVIRRGAVVTAVADDITEQITSVAIVFGGSGYAPSATILAPVTGGPGSGAILQLTTNVSGVVVSGIVASPGIGYSADATFNVDPAAVGANIGIRNLDNGDDSDGDGIVNFPLIPELFGRPIKTGDVLYATLGSDVVRRTIKSVERQTLPSHYGSDDAKADKLFAASVLNPELTSTASFGNTSAPSNWTIALAASSVLRLTLDNAGSNYTSQPVVAISAPIAVSGALAWPTTQAAATASIDDSGFVTGFTLGAAGAGYYDQGIVGFIIKDGGSGYSATNPPLLLIQAPGVGGVQATVTPVIAGGKITNLKITNPGAKYVLPVGNVSPYASGLTFEGGAGTGAQIILIPNVGCVRGATITVPGAYTTPPILTFAGANSSVAAGLAYLGTTLLTVSAPGTGYTVNDLLTLSGGTSVTVATAIVRSITGGGGIDTIEIVEEGAYSTVPGNSVSLTGGSGNSATVDVTWGVSEIRMTNPGVGYSAVDAVITFGSGAGAATPDVVEAVSVTVTGGGGSGATATATLVSDPLDWDGLLQGAIYNGQYGERYTITVTAGGVGVNEARVRIRSNSGAFSANNVPAYHYGLGYLVNHVALGGLAIELRYSDAGQPLRLGDQFSFVVNGKYEPLQLSSTGEVLAINIIDGGDYSGAPTDVIIDAPPAGGTQATASLTFVGTAITEIDIINPGSGYPYPPVVTIVGGTIVTPAHVEAVVTLPETSADLALVQSSVYNGPKNTRYRLEVIQGSDLGLTDDNFGGAKVRVTDTSGIDTIQEYILTNGVQYDLGTYGLKFIFPSGLESPSGLGSPTSATATAVMELGVVPGINAAGTNYLVGDVLTLSTASVVAATVRVTSINGGGGITGLSIVTRGSYTTLSATSSVTGGAGASATLNAITYRLKSVTITDPGDGYVEAPGVSIVGGGGTGAIASASVNNGLIGFITVISRGSGYTSLPTLEIDDPISFQKGLRKGDTYFVDAVASAKVGPASVIVLSGQAADITGWTDVDLLDNKFSIDVRILYTGVLIPKRNTAPTLAYEVGDASVGGILVKDRLAIFIAERDTDNQWIEVKASDFSRLFAQWRGLVPAASNAVIKLYSVEGDITTDFGIFDTDNPVSYGAVIAFRGAQGKAVFVGKVASNDLDGYNMLLRQAETLEGAYALAAMTYDRAVQLAIKQHVDKTSAPNWKLWRRAYGATKNPGTYAVMNLDSNDNTFEATVTANASGNVRVICTNGDFLVRGIQSQDIFRTNFAADEWGADTWDEFEVLSVLESDELILKTGPASPISPAARFEIWRPDNGLSQAQFIGDRSNSFLDRRYINVWTDTPILIDANGEVQFQELIYLAAETAGLRSAVLPQQGLTYTELNQSVTGAPLMFTKYTQDELDVAAANGTWIVTQETGDGPVFIRHQLTTDSVHGALFYEDSVGTNLDNIAYSVKDIFQPYIGKRNANPETLEELETKMRDLLDQFKLNPGGFSQIGPALIAYSGLSVTIDPVFRDRIVIVVTLELPLPINTITITLKATTISDQTLIEFTQTQLAQAA